MTIDLSKATHPGSRRSIYDGDDWVVSPEAILRRCILNGLITLGEARLPNGDWDPVFEEAAIDAAEDLKASWSEGEGFGSSDFTFLAQDFLGRAGIKTEFVNGRLTRI